MCPYNKLRVYVNRHVYIWIEKRGTASKLFVSHERNGFVCVEAYRGRRAFLLSLTLLDSSVARTATNAPKTA